MKKNLFRLSSLLALVALISCSQKKLTQAQQKEASAPPVPVITHLGMERTPCFGRCPSYLLEVKDDGMVRYYGYMFTQHSGIYEIGIGPQAASLLKEFAAYRPDTCKDEYELPIADLPGINYTITFSNNETKTIRNAHFGPAFLKNYAQKLDQTLQVDDSWRVIADTATR